MRNLSLYFFVVVFVCSMFISADEVYSQCSCWVDGLQSQFVSNSLGTECRIENERLTVISGPSVGDECGYVVALSAGDGECGRARFSTNPNPLLFCPGIGLGGPDPEGVCEQEIEEFCAKITVPTLSEWGLLTMAAILGIIGFIVVRRRKVLA